MGRKKKLSQLENTISLPMPLNPILVRELIEHLEFYALFAGHVCVNVSQMK